MGPIGAGRFSVAAPMRWPVAPAPAPTVATYRGEDRRAPTVWASPAGRQLGLALLLLIVVAAVAASIATTDPHPSGIDLRALNAVLATACAAVAIVAGFVSSLRWRMVGSASSLRLAAALFALSAVVIGAVLIPFVHPAARSDISLARVSSALASTVVVLLAVAVVARPVDTRITATRTAWSVALTVAVLLAVAWFVPALGALLRSYRPPPVGAGDLAAHVVVVTTWVLLGVISLARGLRRGSWLWTWSALLLFGFAGAALLASAADTADDMWSTGAYALRLLALLFVLNGVGQELKLAYLDQRARLFDSRVSFEADQVRKRAELAEREERAHEAHSALLGIQAATCQLAEDYDDYAIDTRRTLRHALEAEIELLRALVDGDGSAPPEEFDVAEVVGPIVVCHRAAGEVVDADLPPGINAVGHPAVVAEVVQSLLDNAREHAPNTPVLVRTRRDGTAAVIRVEDRGPGVSPDRVARIFDRGESTSGSGLGLYVARRLLREERGDIQVEPRPGGGASFVVSVPLASLRTRGLGGTELLHHTDHTGHLGQTHPLDAVDGQQ